MNISTLLFPFLMTLSLLIGSTRGHLRRGLQTATQTVTTATTSKVFLGGSGLLNNRKLESINLPLDYEIGLEIEPKDKTVRGWGSIVHFTATNTNCCDYGSRIPGVWFRPGTRKLMVVDGHTANGNSHTGKWNCNDKVLELAPNSKHRLRMVFKRRTVSVFVNDIPACTNIPRVDRKIFKNVHVYVSNPWDKAANADVTNLYFKPLAEPGRITCPVIGMLIKNGDLVPSVDSDGLPFITKEQTKLALLKRGISMEIATKSTNGNFKSEACESCPVKINPFEMNIIKDGESVENQEDKPHEHFRSTGIRDNDAEGPDEDLYNTVEKALFGGNKWRQWSPKQILRLVELFNRSPVECRNKGGNNVLCSNDEATNIAKGTFQGSIHNMLVEFHDPTTGLITQETFKKMWLENEFPSYTTCKDKTFSSFNWLWYDKRGSKYNCAWYAADTDRCARDGSDHARTGYTANTACCACGGGVKPDLRFEPAGFRSLSLEDNKNQNAPCRDGLYKKYRHNNGKYALPWPDTDHSLDKCKELCEKDSQCKAISWCENGDCCQLYDRSCDHPWEGVKGYVSLKKKC